MNDNDVIKMIPFPAFAGINRQPDLGTDPFLSVPRVRGDKPY